MNDLLVLYRVKLDDTRIVDVLAVSTDEAARLALSRHSNHNCAQCLGRTRDLEAKGRMPRAG